MEEPRSVKEDGQTNIRKVLIVGDLKVFLKNNIVNMVEKNKLDAAIEKTKTKIKKNEY
tara:strand:- start:2048 stop:2221 length:174 start_codon:yes stop_codon:yes gene_type:complete